MRILKIEHENFRNLSNGSLIPDEKINIIYGDNAQGKTNFLESIWLFTGGKSFRGAKDLDLISFSQKQATVSAKVFLENREQDLKIELTSPKRKTYVNGNLKKNSSEYVGKFCSVVFSPAHLSLIKDGPGHRRKFLDTAICQISPYYAKTVSLYNHILDQRNKLIKDMVSHPELEQTLPIWDEKLACAAGEIIQKRLQYVNLLKENTKSIYSDLSNNKENLEISYISNIFSKKNSDNKSIENLMLDRLEKSRKEDRFLGFTTVGPHRDDLDIYVNGKKAKIFASQGQQRSVILSMKLSESMILEKMKGKTPVILFDDVLSELDKKRQHYILNSISNRQVFITCCEPSSVDRLIQGKTFEIKNGAWV